MMEVENRLIPKKIYYCWFGHNKINDEIKKNINGWECLNPDYQIIEINEKIFNWEQYSFSREAYRLKKWAFVSDIARMYILFNNGGFCLDTDVKLLTSINKLRHYKNVWCLETSGLINPGLIIGAEKGDKDLQNIFNLYKNLNFNSKLANKSLKSPDIVTKYFRSIGLGIRNKNQILKNNQLILSSQCFAPYHWWGGGHITKNTIGIHQYANSWGANLKVSYRVKKMKDWECNFPVSYFFCRNVIRKLNRLIKNDKVK